ncbi:MAG: hypothetical protein JST89_03045 [Cyanobacteria bacterium SZAS-4]|nr:hypothetical protein [Cyanobacteria bacterium SZAS-4]
MYFLKAEQNLHDTTYDAMALSAEPALSQPVGHSNGWRCARQFYFEDIFTSLAPEQ